MKLHAFMRVVALTAALGCSAKSTSAAPIVFSDRTTFQAAAGPTSVLTFNDLPEAPLAACLPWFPYSPDPCELDYGGATFVSTLGIPDFQQPPLMSVDSWFGISTSNALHSNAIPVDDDDFYFTFESNAVGFVLGAGGETPIYIKVEDVLGQTWNYSVIVDDSADPFFGLVSDVVLRKVSLFTGPWPNEFGFEGLGNFAIDDVELGPVPVPEPSTLALLLGGLVVVARRRLRSNS